MKEWIDCPNEGCDSQMKYDPDDREYSCGACALVLKHVLSPNEEESLYDRETRILLKDLRT